MGLAQVSLDDKYTQESGRIYLTGSQVLVRLPLVQRRLDLAAGLSTAGFVSGYRGSPLGGLDQQFWQAGKHLDEHHILFRPGVNEDLAATAVWGTQQAGHFGDGLYDGVFAMWYGKGPGVDRSGDAFKHANLAGTARHGGVIALAGDDHMAKSSTTAHQSEFAFIDAMIPVISPSGVQEFLDLGLHGFALSRFAGLWVGFKCIGETVDSAAVVQVDPNRVVPQIPGDVEMPEGGLNTRVIVAEFLMLEELLHRYKIPAALAYARANRLDRVVIGGPGRRIGIVTSGKSYLDVRQAFDDLGIGEETARALGLSLYKVAMTWPLEPEGARAFAEGLDEVIVVEEKRSLIEWQLKDALYGLPADRRPRVIGKTDETGRTILPANGELTPGLIGRVLADRLKLAGGPDTVMDGLAERIAAMEARQATSGDNKPAEIVRTPYFCSGCPHNTSTRVPEGSRAGAGIGCHYMAQWMDRNTATFTHMGAEGANWTGQAPFVETKHIFQNIGDGTYFHSGLLAIRAAVASGANITYKILYNDAVAMTGGQPVDGPLDPVQIAWQVWAEGVKRIVVATDEPEKYPKGTHWPEGVKVEHRHELDRVQRELREIEGTTVLIYDQTCAAEKRRRRKRGTFPDPQKRVFINEQVCEGCGDCGVKSNCVSVQPVETELGRKRQIDQSSCNKDFSCLEGFCPSFVTVYGGRPRRRAGADVEPASDLPHPTLPELDRPWSILVTGIGGTGVVTIGAVLSMAAHIEGKAATVMDMTGLAQKGGAVWSHLRIGREPDDLHAVRIASGSADALVGCDLVVSGQPDTVSKLARGRSRVVVNDHCTFTGAFTRDPDLAFPTDAVRARIAGAVGEDAADFLDATRLATALMGDSIATNMFMTGLAWQRGLIPISLDAIDRALELNGVAVESNKKAFHWGRVAAHDQDAVLAAAEMQKPATPEAEEIATTLDEIVRRRVEFLTGYQSRRYARRYEALVDLARRAEAEKTPGKSGFAEAVARYAFKLMAYKDEYEVARLYTDGSFRKALENQFEGDYRIELNLAPPVMSKTDPVTGEPKKRQFGPWMLKAMGVLVRLKVLRGTPLDPFGRTEERKTERRLITEYEAAVEALVAGLTRETHAIAVAIARVPEKIRGYGHVKQRHLEAARAEEARLWEEFRAPPVPTPQREAVAAE